MTRAARGFVAEEDVLGDRQQRNQRQFLVDDDDAGVFRVADGGELALGALEEDLPVIAAVGIDAGQHLHQGGLASPFSPTTAWISPGMTERLTSVSAFTPGNVLVMPRIFQNGLHRPRERELGVLARVDPGALPRDQPVVMT